MNGSARARILALTIVANCCAYPLYRPNDQNEDQTHEHQTHEALKLAVGAGGERAHRRQLAIQTKEVASSLSVQAQEAQGALSPLSTICPRVSAYDPISADCATSALVYVSKKAASFQPCTTAAPGAEATMEKAMQDIQKMAREDGLEDKYASRFTVSNLEESGVDYRGPLQKMRDAVSPITANVWTDNIKDQDDYEQRCWYLGDEVHKYSPQNIVDIDYETQRVTMDDGKIFGNDLITQCAVSATMDRAFKAEADRGLIKEW